MSILTKIGYSGKAINSVKIAKLWIFYVCTFVVFISKKGSQLFAISALDLTHLSDCELIS